MTMVLLIQNKSKELFEIIKQTKKQLVLWQKLWKTCIMSMHQKVKQMRALHWVGNK